jgi:hypothetical protein
MASTSTRSESLQQVFAQLKTILQQHAAGFSVSEDSPARFAIDAEPGPATLRAWRGEMRRKRIPVAWVEINKAHVSYHLMSAASPRVRRAMSKSLAARMQGKTCFNFKASDATLFRELGETTVLGLAAFRDDGFIRDRV